MVRYINHCDTGQARHPPTVSGNVPSVPRFPEAQTELAQAELGLVQAEVGYRLAVTAVEHATGGLLDRYHVQVAQLSQ